MALPLPSLGEKRGKQVVYTIEECKVCKLKTKRHFQVNDYVYKDSGECPKCKTRMTITMIYAEPVKP